MSKPVEWKPTQKVRNAKTSINHTMLDVLPTQCQAGGHALSDCCTTDLAYTMRSVVSVGQPTLHEQYSVYQLTRHSLDMSLKLLLQRSVE